MNIRRLFIFIGIIFCLLGHVSHLWGQCTPPNQPNVWNATSECPKIFNLNATNYDYSQGSSMRHHWYTSSTGFVEITTGITTEIHNNIFTSTLRKFHFGNSTTTYYVSTEVNDCESGRKPVTVTVNNDVPDPSIHINLSPTLPRCYGDFVFTSNASQGNQWKFNSVNNLSTATNISGATGQTLVPDKSGYYWLTQTNACGSVTQPVVQPALKIEIIPLKKPTINISGSTNVCPGATITFTSHVTYAGGNPSYQWRVNGSPMGGNSHTFTSSTLNEGDEVTCKLTSNSNECISTSIIISEPAIVNLRDLPTEPGVHNLILDCPGSVTLNATNYDYIPDRGMMHHWYASLTGSTEITSGISREIHNNILTTSLSRRIGSVTTKTFYVSTEMGGCETARVAVSATVVNSNPSPEVFINVNPTAPRCHGEMVFSSNMTNGNQWKYSSIDDQGSAVNIDGATEQIYIPDRTGYYWLTQTNSCESATVNVVPHNHLEIQIIPNVEPSVTISANPGTTVCPDETITFTASTNEGESDADYQWLLNGVAIEGATTSSYALTPSSSGQEISCILTTSLACSTQPTVVSNILSITGVPAELSIEPAPGTVICAGTSIIFNVEMEHERSVEWFQDEDFLANGKSYITPPLYASTTYQVEASYILNDKLCTDEIEVPVNISVNNHLPTNKPYMEKMEGGQYKLYKNNQDDHYYSYRWKDKWDDIGNSRIITQPGVYELVSINPDNCAGGAQYIEVPNLHPDQCNDFNIDNIDNMNYIRKFNFRKEMQGVGTPINLIANDVSTSTKYFDGLARVIQVVEKQASSELHDLVYLKCYDFANRERFEFLPYSSTLKDGSFKSQPLTGLLTFYDPNAKIRGSQYPFKYNYYDNSPLNRLTRVSLPGESWVGVSGTVDNKDISYIYRTCRETDQVHKWNIVNGELTSSGVYETGSSLYGKSLVVTETTDEESHQVIEFKDKLGQTILKRVQADEGATTWADTYYIYDDFGNLRYVLPPEAVNEIGSPSTPYTIPQNLLDRWAFQYTYDGRNRMVKKKVPGAEKVYMIYDKRDRLVLTKDGNQRANDQWLFTKYDAFNRPMATGFYHDPLGRGDMQQKVNDYYAYDLQWESLNGISQEGNIITKTTADNWGNAGGYSNEIAGPGQDTYVRVVATETNTARMFGISANSANDNYNTIGYAIYLRSDGYIYLYNSGVKTPNINFGKYQPGDILEVRREGGDVSYYKNDEWLYTDAEASTSSLVADFALSTQGSTLHFSIPEMYETKGGDHFDYSSYSFPYNAQDDDYLTVTYYDDYNFHHAGLPDYAFVSDDLNSTYFDRVKGQVTGSLTKVLGTDKWLRAVNYYDDRYRVIQTVIDNNLGGVDRTSSQYDFVGKVLKTSTSHNTSAPIIWRNQKNIEVKGGVFTSTTTGWNAGVSSVNELQEGEDGWVEFIVNETETSRFIGFNDFDETVSHAEIDFSLYVYGNSLRAYQNGSLQDVIGIVKKGDVIRLSREGNVIKVYINDEEVYAYTQTSTSAFHIDMS